MAGVPDWHAGGASSVYTTETGGLCRYPRLGGSPTTWPLGASWIIFSCILGWSN